MLGWNGVPVEANCRKVTIKNIILRDNDKTDHVMYVERGSNVTINIGSLEHFYLETDKPEDAVIDTNAFKAKHQKYTCSSGDTVYIPYKVEIDRTNSSLYDGELAAIKGDKKIGFVKENQFLRFSPYEKFKDMFKRLEGLTEEQAKERVKEFFSLSVEYDKTFEYIEAQYIKKSENVFERVYSGRRYSSTFTSDETGEPTKIEGLFKKVYNPNSEGNISYEKINWIEEDHAKPMFVYYEDSFKECTHAKIRGTSPEEYVKLNRLDTYPGRRYSENGIEGIYYRNKRRRIK